MAGRVSARPRGRCCRGRGLELPAGGPELAIDLYVRVREGGRPAGRHAARGGSRPETAHPGVWLHLGELRVAVPGGTSAPIFHVATRLFHAAGPVLHSVFHDPHNILGPEKSKPTTCWGQGGEVARSGRPGRRARRRALRALRAGRSRPGRAGGGRPASRSWPRERLSPAVASGCGPGELLLPLPPRPHRPRGAPPGPPPEVGGPAGGSRRRGRRDDACAAGGRRPGGSLSGWSPGSRLALPGGGPRLSTPRRSPRRRPWERRRRRPGCPPAGGPG